MIDVVEELYVEGQAAIDETYRLEAVKNAVVQALYQLDESRRESIRETGNRLTPEYDKLERMLGNVQDFIDGRIQELNPFYCERSYMFFDENAPIRVELRQAQQEGINYVALKGLPSDEYARAVEYISEHGLASMNYEATCQAVEEFRQAEREQSLSATQSKKGV